MRWLLSQQPLQHISRLRRRGPELVTKRSPTFNVIVPGDGVHERVGEERRDMVVFWKRSGDIPHRSRVAEVQLVLLRWVFCRSRSVALPQGGDQRGGFGRGSLKKPQLRLPENRCGRAHWS